MGEGSGAHRGLPDVEIKDPVPAMATGDPDTPAR